MDSEQNVVQKILSGTNPKAMLLAAKGLMPLPPQELVALQVHLTNADDPNLAATAKASLAEVDPKIASDVVAGGPAPEVLAYFARHTQHQRVLEALITRRDIDKGLLVVIADRLAPESQEILLLRQDAIIEKPEILEALERNPQLSKYSRRRIREYREHLLPRERKERKTRAELEAEAEAVTDEELASAIEEAKQVEATGDRDEDTGLTEAQIRTMAVPVRMKLARGAPKTLRNILIRDPNPMVATSVLQSNPLGDGEVEQIASNRAVVAEVLEAVGRNRSWLRKYPVILALARNPRSPVGLAMRLLPRLAVRDLKALGRDRNIANAVRTTAAKLYKMKRM